jgi:hypothetical protein
MYLTLGFSPRDPTTAANSLSRDSFEAQSRLAISNSGYSCVIVEDVVYVKCDSRGKLKCSGGCVMRESWN